MQLEDYFDFLSADDIRIKGHRIGIDDVLDLYLEGYSPEEIVQYYGTLQPVEVYATITYYHQNRAEVDAYLARVRAWREQHWQELAEREPPEVVKRLRALRAERARQQSYPWMSLQGLATHPYLGEDAQAWVSRSRQEREWSTRDDP